MASVPDSQATLLRPDSVSVWHRTCRLTASSSTTRIVSSKATKLCTLTRPRRRRAPARGRALPSQGLLAIYGRVSRVPPHPSGGKNLPEVAEVEQLEELGDDAIIAHQQGAHAPKPRAQVTEEARSV